ncbi:MAG: glycosyl hydrolase family 43, partial [Sphingobacteriaceae bacterium]
DWTKSPEPVFQKSIENSVYAPGHNSFFKSRGGEDWLIYHANSATGQGCGGMRSPRIQKFNWNPDGTPNFGIPVKTGVALIRPAGE